MNKLTTLSARLSRIGVCLGFALFSFSAQAATITWTGNTDNIYTKPGNWDLGRVPNWMDAVIIPVRANQPVLDAALGIGVAGNLTINAGATLTLNPQSELDLYGNLTDNGTFVGMGSLSVKQPLDGSTPTHAIGGTGATVAISDLLINANAPTVLTIQVRLTRQLALASNLTANSTLTMLSTPTVTSFVVNNGGAVVGSVTVQRAIDASVNAGVGYRHYSSPVANTTVADFITSGYTPVLTQSYNDSPTPPATTPFPTLYFYDQAFVNRNNTSPNFDKGFIVPFSLNAPLLVGRGYTANLNGAQLVDFVGTLNNGDISLTLSRNAPGTLNSDVAGYQFLGNPYPSSIDWSRLTPAQLAAADIADGMYVFSSTSQYGGYYRAYQGGVGNPVIPMAQGFFVRKASAGSSTFTLTNALRVTTSDGTTFQRPVADVRPQLEMALRSSDKVVQDMLNVYFQNGSTAGVDTKYDALKMQNNNGMFLGTLTADGQELAIDGRPLPTDQLTIPLHVAVSATGTYTLATAKLANMGDLRVYLHDKRLGSFTDLSQQPEYTFNLSTANPSARFELVFSKQALNTMAPAALTQQVDLYPSPAKGKAFLELPTSLGNEVIATTLVDAMGRTVRKASLAAEGEATRQVDLDGLRSGVYVLQLHTSAGIVAKRLVVE